MAISLLCLAAADAQSFDVVSIHPQAPDDTRFYVRLPANGEFSATGSTARLLLMIAYDVQETQISGGPGWFPTAKWVIDAKAAEGSRYSHEETQRMLQTLLADRFALRFHRETQQRPVYALTISKNGPKFKASDHQHTNVRVSGKSIIIERGNIARMIEPLASALGRPVIDRTGLSGVYDLSLQWDDAPNPNGGAFGQDAPAAPGNDRGSIFTAIQDQLGLRLESQRAPVEVIVLDRLERPSEN